jgi:NADH-quinone oxidoreductase subunit J
VIAPLFAVLAVLTLAAALMVVLHRNPVYSALGLVATLFLLAVFFIGLDAHMVAALQIIVYAGAIVVLFLFVIMLLGVDRRETLTEHLRFQRPLAVALGLLLLAEVLLLAGHTWATGAKTASGVPIEGGGDFGNNIQRVARVLFTDFL